MLWNIACFFLHYVVYRYFWKIDILVGTNIYVQTSRYPCTIKRTIWRLSLDWHYQEWCYCPWRCFGEFPTNRTFLLRGVFFEPINKTSINNSCLVIVEKFGFTINLFAKHFLGPYFATRIIQTGWGLVIVSIIQLIVSSWSVFFCIPLIYRKESSMESAVRHSFIIETSDC